MPAPVSTDFGNNRSPDSVSRSANTAAAHAASSVADPPRIISFAVLVATVGDGV
jgi:hypothetical protein